MSNVIAWIAAEAEPPLPGSAGLPRRARDLRIRDLRIRDPRVREQEEKRSAERLPAHLPAHQFPAPSPLPANPAGNGASGAEIAEPVALAPRDQFADEERERERRIYRGRTVAMLRRYLRYSIEAGRLPSLLGSEFFRAKVTAYTVVTFEDRVIFVHDMEKCLDRLDDFSRQLIARHILQEHDRWATAKLLHCNEKTIRRYTPVVLDLLSEILIEVGLMKRRESNQIQSDQLDSNQIDSNQVDSNQKNSCQEGESDQIFASDCDDEEYKF